MKTHTKKLHDLGQRLWGANDTWRRPRPTRLASNAAPEPAWTRLCAQWPCGSPAAGTWQ